MTVNPGGMRNAAVFYSATGGPAATRSGSGARR